MLFTRGVFWVYCIFSLNVKFRAYREREFFEISFFTKFLTFQYLFTLLLAVVGTKIQKPQMFLFRNVANFKGYLSSTIDIQL